MRNKVITRIKETIKSLIVFLISGLFDLVLGFAILGLIIFSIFSYLAKNDPYFCLACEPPEYYSIRGGKYQMNIPKGIKYGEISKVQFSLVRDSSITLQRFLSEESQTIAISSHVNCELVELGKSKLEIKKLNTDNYQVVDKNGYTTWTWNIIPKQTGKTYLSIIINNKLSGNNDSGFDYLLQEEEIKIKGSFFRQLYDFISDNWISILSLVIIPILIYLFQRIHLLLVLLKNVFLGGSKAKKRVIEKK